MVDNLPFGTIDRSHRGVSQFAIYHCGVSGHSDDLGISFQAHDGVTRDFSSNEPDARAERCAGVP